MTEMRYTTAMKVCGGEHVSVQGIDFDAGLWENETGMYNKAFERFEPVEVCICLKQGNGPAAVPAVSVGEHVLCGQLIGETISDQSLPVYASLSGVVTRIIEKRFSVSEVVSHIVIRREGQSHTWIQGSFMPGDKFSRLKKMGIAGITAREMDVSDHATAHKQVIRIAAFDREPQVFCDYRLIMECPGKVLFGADVMADILGGAGVEIYICHEEVRYLLEKTLYNYKKALRFLDQARFFSVKPDIYHKSCIAAREGLWFSATELCAVYDGFYDGRPMTGRGITIGGAVKHPKNLWVPNGTSVRDLLEFCGGIQGEKDHISRDMSELEHFNIVEGGPMGGHCVDVSCAWVSLTTGSIHVLPEIYYREHMCIQCRSCCQVCPVQLKPFYIEKALDKGAVRVCGADAHACIGCGWCSYVCPSYRRLKEKITAAGKAASRKEGPVTRDRRSYFKKKAPEKRKPPPMEKAGAYIELDWEIADELEPLPGRSQGGPYIHKKISTSGIFNRFTWMFAGVFLVYSMTFGPEILFKALAAGISYGTVDWLYRLGGRCHLGGWRASLWAGLICAMALAFVPSWRWLILAGAAGSVWAHTLKGSGLLAGITISLLGIGWAAPVHGFLNLPVALAWAGAWLYMIWGSLAGFWPGPVFLTAFESVSWILLGRLVWSPMILMGGVLFANDYKNGGKGTWQQTLAALLSGAAGAVFSLILPGDGGICLGLLTVNIMACNLNTHTI